MKLFFCIKPLLKICKWHTLPTEKIPSFLTGPEFRGSQSQEDSRLVTGNITVVEVSLTSHSQESENDPGFSTRECPLFRIRTLWSRETWCWLVRSRAKAAFTDLEEDWKGQILCGSKSDGLGEELHKLMGEWGPIWVLAPTSLNIVIVQ